MMNESYFEAISKAVIPGPAKWAGDSGVMRFADDVRAAEFAGKPKKLAAPAAEHVNRIKYPKKNTLGLGPNARKPPTQ